MNKMVMALVATLMAMTAQVASAASTFSFSFAGQTTTGTPGTLSGSGFFQTNDGAVDPADGSTTFLITNAGGTISLNGAVIATINGVVPFDPPASDVIVQEGNSFTLIDTVLGTSRGVFALVFNNNASGTYNVSFTDIAASDATLTVAAIPEPATWAMMLLGFAIVGAALRRRRPAMLAA